MECPICGNALSAGARFCGRCGKQLNSRPAVVAADASLERPEGALRQRLSELARMLREAGTPEYLSKALDTLADGPRAAGDHLTAVVGEKGRGKTTLINRLLGASVLPTGRNSYRVPLLVRAGPEWQVVDAEGVATGTALPVAAKPPLQAIQGPSAVLRISTILDTPPLNEVELDFEARVVAELVHADTFLICVAANQLLSQNERDLIRQRLLPLLAGDGALVVTHVDALETDEDRRDIRARAERFGGSKLRTLFLPAQPAAPAAEVLQFMAESARKRFAQQASSWRRKVAALVGGIEQELAREPEEEAPSPSLPSREERLLALTRLLESEHALALAEAESALRLQLSAVRLSLSGRVAHWTPDHARHEGVSEVATEMQAALRHATQLYVSSLERSLMSGVPRSLQVAAENVAALAPGLGSDAAVLTEPVAVQQTRQRDLRVPLLVIATAGLFIVSPVAAPIAGVFMSYQLRKSREKAFEKQVRANTAPSLSNWIAIAEPELLEQLRQEVRPVLATVMARVESVLEAAPPPRRASRRIETLALTRECLALARSDAATRSAEVNS